MLRFNPNYFNSAIEGALTRQEMLLEDSEWFEEFEPLPLEDLRPFANNLKEIKYVPNSP